jgi:hypothetical protein
MDIIANLLSVVTENRVRLAGNGALCEISQETVKHRAGVARTGEAAAAEAGRLHSEIPAVFLHHNVCGKFGRTKQAVQASIDAHGLVDAESPEWMLRGYFPSQALFDKW